MRTTLLSLLSATVLLTACNSSVQTTSISEQNKNPYTAQRYGQELADRMADLVINKDPIINKAGVMETINETIAEGKKIQADAESRMNLGYRGPILEGSQQVSGYVLYLSDTLYFSSDFVSDPGPNLHLYLTTVVDPRDVVFPDNTSIDLGEIQSLYGASQYNVPHQDKPELYRTVVFWDTDLQRLYGFAQISR